MIIDRLWKSQPGAYFFLCTKSAAGHWRDVAFKRREIGSIGQFIEDNRDKDIYFCPHGFNRPKRVKEHAELPQLLWADLDAADPRKVKWRPTIAIESSPGRFVGLWLLDGEMSEGLNRRLTYAMGSDVSGWDLTQVLRVPGTINYKYETLPRTRIMWSDGPEYTVRSMERQLPAEMDEGSTEETDAAEIYKRWEKKLPHWARRELISGKPTPGKRSEMLWKLGNTLIEVGVSRGEAFVLLKSSPWNKFAGRRNEDAQIRRELDKSVNKHMKGERKREEEEAEDDYVWVARSLADVEEENIEWIWYPYLARGEITILEGDPGLGKSYLAQMVAGHLIDGKKLPSVKEVDVVTGNVAYFDIENSAGSVTKKRIVGNGFKNLSGYYQEEALFSIDDDDCLVKVCEALEKVKPVMVCFDTINTYLGKADAFKGHEAQQAFVKFKKIAKRFNCAVVVIRHLTKGSKDKALYRGQGSIAFAGVARVIITVGSMPGDEDTRAFAITKMNIAKKPRAHTFTIDALPDTDKEKDRSRFAWGEFVDLTSDELIVAATTDKKESRGEAEEFLKEAMDEGSIEFRKLERMAEARSISLRTLQRAATELGVEKKTSGFGKTKKTTWSLPDTPR